MSALKQRIPRGEFARGVAVLTSGSVVAQIVTVGSMPIIARLYSPSDFGVLAVYVSLVSVLLSIASLRYEQAIPIAEEDATAVQLVLLCFVIIACVSATTALATLVVGRATVAWLNMPRLMSYLWLLPIGIAGAGAYQVLSLWAVRKKRYGRLTRTRLTQSVSQVVVQLTARVFSAGPIGLLIADQVGRGAGVTTLWSLLRNSGASLRPDRGALGAAARRYVKFPLVTTWASLLNIGSLQLPAVLLAASFGPEVTGHYAMGYRLLGAPTALLGAAVGQVLFARAAELAKDERALRQLTERSLLLLYSFSLPVFAIVGITAPVAFQMVFGRQWTAAGVYAQLLAPWFLFWFVSSPMSCLLSVREWQGSALAFTAAEFSLRAGSIWLGARMHSPKLAIGLLSAAGVLVSVVSIGRFLQAGYSSPLSVVRKCSRVTATAAVCLLPAAVAAAVHLDRTAVLLAIAGAAAYAAILTRKPRTSATTIDPAEVLA